MPEIGSAAPRVECTAQPLCHVDISGADSVASNHVVHRTVNVVKGVLTGLKTVVGIHVGATRRDPRRIGDVIGVSSHGASKAISTLVH